MTSAYPLRYSGLRSALTTLLFEPSTSVMAGISMVEMTGSSLVVENT